MTGEDRARIRKAIDAAKRERLRRAGRDSSACSGCGGELLEVTQGCKQCGYRARHRLRLERDPEYREREWQAAKRSREMRRAGLWSR